MTEIAALVMSLGMTLPFVLLPGAFLHAADVMGWQVMLKQIRQPISFASLFKYHVSSEAIARSIPAGIPLADSVRSLLLKKDDGVPLTGSFAGILSRRWSLGVTQCAYLVIGSVLSFPVITRVSHIAFRNGTLAWIIITGGSILFLLFMALPSMLEGFAPMEWIVSVLGRIPVSKLAQWLHQNEDRFVKADENLAVLHKAGYRRLVVSSLWYSGTWIMELTETYILLRIVGIDASLQQAIAMEILVSSMRMAAFFLPAGIGVQEAGYAGIIAALGLSGGQAGTTLFIIAKRTRDLLWIIAGYTLLLIQGVLPSRKSISIQLTGA